MLHTPTDIVAERQPMAAAEGGIRPFAAADAPQVAALLVRAFQKSDKPAPAGMVAYLREIYLKTPGYDPTLSSRVFARADGRITGFVGVSPLPLLIKGRKLRGAVTSSLAVDPAHADPMTAPRLLREIRNLPHDALLSDRSNNVSLGLLRTLRAEAFLNYSLDWVRVIRPAAFALNMLASRLGPARFLAPLAIPFDRIAIAKGLASDEPHWSVPGQSRLADSVTDRPASFEQLADLIPDLLEQFTLRPDWSREQLLLVLGDGAQKSSVGSFVSRVVIAANGEPIGLFLYHGQKGRVAEVLQIMALPGREGVVIDRAIAHAAAMGAVAIRGRAQPVLMEELMERRAIFAPELSTVVFSRDAEVLNAFRDGTAFFTGLAGENWMRLNGDSF